MSGRLILVPLDGTPRARVALPVARAFGKIMAAHLHMLHVSHDRPMPLAKLAGRLGLEASALQGCSIAARMGEPSSTIIDEAQTRQARLIVMCAHTAAGRTDAILGHTALDVLRQAPCPVVLVPPGMGADAWRPKRILLPYDGSTASNVAVGPAARLACQAGVELIVVQIATADPVFPVDRGTVIMPRYIDQAQHEWPSWTGALFERLSGLCQDELHAKLRILGGEPAREIARMALPPDSLIVLAWKGEWIGERARTLKGVLRDATCPVLIVQAPKEHGFGSKL